MKTDTRYLNQIPTLKALIEIGYQYLPNVSHSEKGLTHSLLENVLEKQLRRLNCFSYRNKKYEISDEIVGEAISKLKQLAINGGIYGNQVLYDFISTNQIVSQIIKGKRRSFDLLYIDWQDIENNACHCAVEYIGKGESKFIRSNIVLFINGIPLAIIECQSLEEEIEQANLGKKFIDPEFSICEQRNEYLGAINLNNYELLQEKNAQAIYEIENYLIKKMGKSIGTFSIKINEIILRKKMIENCRCESLTNNLSIQFQDHLKYH